MSLNTWLFSIAMVILVIAVIIPHRSKLNVKRIGRDPGFLGLNLQTVKKEFALNGHRLVDESYHKCKDTNFIVQTQDMERLVLSPKYLPELRMLPESKLSHSAALVEHFLGHYSRLDIILHSHQHSDVCRVHLTQHLPKFLPDMAAELRFSMSQVLAACNLEEYAPIPAYDCIYSMILSISSRVFVGLPLGRDKAWLDIISDYLAEVLRTANALRPYPPFLRPILRPFLAPKHRMDTIISNAVIILSSAIKERQSRDYTQTDILGFLVQTAEVVDPISITLKLLILVSANLHNSAMVTTHTLYHLCERPEYIEALRMEAWIALNKDMGSWQLSTIKKLRRLDSFMKESMRLNPSKALGFNRIVMSPITLSNGMTIPTKTFINLAADPMARDATYYDNPNEFNGDRFFTPSGTNAQFDPLQEFTGIEPGNLSWGNGRLTCPGRWYASAMIKLIIGMLLTQYDIKFPEGQTERPANLQSNGSSMPDMKQVLLLRELS